MRNLMIIMSVWLLMACAPPKTSTGFALEPLGNGIYVHHGQHLDIDTGYQGDICNLSVIVGGQGVAVVDTGGSLHTGQQLRQAIGRITSLPILYVINTHVHPDHIYGNAAFVTDKPQFVGHRKLAAAMKLREEAYDRLNARLLGDNAKGSSIVLSTLEVQDTLTLDLGDRQLKLQAYTEAHTNTDITVMDNKTNTLFAGDLLFTERTPVIESDIKGLIATLELLKTYEVKQIVPGHGAHTRDWKAAIDKELGYLNVLLADIRANIKKNISMESTMDSAAQSERDKWVLFDIANRRNINTLYPKLEWE